MVYCFNIAIVNVFSAVIFTASTFAHDAYLCNMWSNFSVRVQDHGLPLLPSTVDQSARIVSIGCMYDVRESDVPEDL